MKIPSNSASVALLALLAQMVTRANGSGKSRRAMAVSDIKLRPPAFKSISRVKGSFVQTIQK